ncbi:unnamed protein product [Blepharisma stoltei]|uniref:non-specific serine/threonine protein kinase n=1 Tax=Blepharisma stoltei TaxID=1481888 RepID=A0AAU9JTS0_9CILI|nr:unnamed protein product [Blepharisma stoltei]
MGCCNIGTFLNKDTEFPLIPLSEMIDSPSVSSKEKTSPDLLESHATLVSNPSLKIQRSIFIHITQGDIRDFYDVKDFIGNGAYGSVYQVVNKETNSIRAAKMISKRRFKETDRDMLLQEAEALRYFDHPNILKIYDVIEDNLSLYIVTELCTGGDLNDRIRRNNYLSEMEAAKYMYQIMSALYYCHKKNIVHRDLKPENMLFLNEKEGSPLKLIDFGTSCRTNFDKKMRTMIGTANYIAPEIIEGDYDSKCDIWSAGVILFFMLSGERPFRAEDENSLLIKVSKAKYKFDSPRWNEISSEAKELIGKMLTKDPELRPTAKEVLHSGWICEKTREEINYSFIMSNDILERLKNFKGKRNLQQATLSFIVSQLTTNEETEQLQKVFVALDRNGNGKISQLELERAFQEKFFEYDVNIESIFENCDADQNGYIGYLDFLTATLDWDSVLSEERIRAAFNAYDVDKNGLISIEEVKQFLKGDQQIEEFVWNQIFEEADSNHNGFIDFSEFKEALLHNFK